MAIMAIGIRILGAPVTATIELLRALKQSVARNFASPSGALASGHKCQPDHSASLLGMES